MIYVIDDDEIMAKCIAKACRTEVQIFHNALEAMNQIAMGVLPDLIFLDILLDGPDGFTFMNEMVSYNDTRCVPIVIVSSLDYAKQKLSAYGVVGYLNKDTMMPQEIRQYVEKYT